MTSIHNNVLWINCSIILLSVILSNIPISSSFTFVPKNLQPHHQKIWPTTIKNTILGTSSSSVQDDLFSAEGEEDDDFYDDEDEDFLFEEISEDEEEPVEEFKIGYEKNMEDEGKYTGSIPQLQPIRRHRRSKKVPMIAIVGRPNVGKSALVNRIAGTQSGGAIVADESGITRDRTYRYAEFLGENFQIVDTGGLVFDDNDSLFAKEIREQAMIAIDEAAAAILVVDGKSGMTQMDELLGEFLRKEITKQIPVVVAVNKCESEKTGLVAASDFWNLGLGEPFPVSAIHGVGTAELLESVFEKIDEKKSAFDGFGTKVKKLETAKQAVVEAYLNDSEEEDETDQLMRQYGLLSGTDEVIDRYEKAVSAFDEEEMPVSHSYSMRFLSHMKHQNQLPGSLTHFLWNDGTCTGRNQCRHHWTSKCRQIITAQHFIWRNSCHCK